MKLRNAILSGLMFGLAHGVAVNAEPTKGYFTMDAMGCMLLKECTKDVERINSSIDLMNAFPDSDWDVCLLYTSPSPRDGLLSRMPSSA